MPHDPKGLWGFFVGENMAKKTGSSADGFERAREQYSGKFGVESGPVPLQRWHKSERRVGESQSGSDLRPEAKTTKQRKHS